MYTTAGFVVLGGMGAAWSHRPATVADATAADLFNGTKLADQFVQSAALATPSWTQRIAADLGAPQVDDSAPAQHKSAPTLIAVRKPDASGAQLTADSEETGAEIPVNARPILSPSRTDLAQLPPSFGAMPTALAQTSLPDDSSSSHTSPFTARIFAASTFNAPDITIPPYANPVPVELAAISSDTQDTVATLGYAWGAAETDTSEDSIADEVARDIEKVVEVRPGDTLFGVLVNAGLTQDEAEDAVGALSDVFSPRDLRAGQEITLNIANGSAERDEQSDAQLVSLTFEPDVATDVTLKRNDSGDFIAASVDKELVDANRRVAGVIDSSLFGAAQEAGLPMPVTADLIKIFSFDVDFQRDIQDGDAFEVLYERKETAEGDFVKSGQILFAAMTLSGKTIPVYYFERDGDGQYYTPNGEAIRKSLLRTPVDGARITSGFGMRMHPVMGYSKMHKGIDFGAPTGTPIFAAGAGTVVEVGKKGAYGNYIRIRHNGQYQTAYAHMSKFAKGISKGDKVKQGDVIGYVGATGRVTGPHLHYEILVDGSQVNPAKVKMASGDKLTGKALKAFQAQMAQIDAERQKQIDQQLIAERPLNADMSCGIKEGCQN
ncbi:MAG TPA: peptidoglycan DD-metalloendopeptidase family protein [Dongiaceae bacterium]|nr:peptidoglycan DD-metalloendopeptidase family protein [Dongiaceae bacterium]